MRRLVVALVVLLSLVPPLRAAEPADAIRAVIEGQLQAFRADDGAAAFAYASPKIQGLFGDPERFMTMVRSGYQPVYRPRRHEFRDLVPEAGRLVQRVLLVGPDGVPVIAAYLMQQQPDGSWRIDGCVFERQPEVAA